MVNGFISPPAGLIQIFFCKYCLSLSLYTLYRLSENFPNPNLIHRFYYRYVETNKYNNTGKT